MTDVKQSTCINQLGLYVQSFPTTAEDIPIPTFITHLSAPCTATLTSLMLTVYKVTQISTIK